MLGSSCSSICNFKDVVVHGNTRVVHQSDDSPEGSMAGLLKKRSGHGRSNLSRSLPSSSSLACGSSLQFRKLSGCYKCHTILDPSRYPYNPRSTICSCPKCCEVFLKVESLELRQAFRHAGNNNLKP